MLLMLVWTRCPTNSSQQYCVLRMLQFPDAVAGVGRSPALPAIRGIEREVRLLSDLVLLCFRVFSCVFVRFCEFVAIFRIATDAGPTAAPLMTNCTRSSREAAPRCPHSKQSLIEFWGVRTRMKSVGLCAGAGPTIMQHTRARILFSDNLSDSRS